MGLALAKQEIDSTEVTVDIDGQEVVIHRDGRVEGVSLATHNKGYQVFWVRRKQYFVHRLVAEHFVPNPDGHPHVRFHGEKSDPSADNLYWTDQWRGRRKGSRNKRTQQAEGWVLQLLHQYRRACS